MPVTHEKKNNTNYSQLLRGEVYSVVRRSHFNDYDWAAPSFVSSRIGDRPVILAM